MLTVQPNFTTRQSSNSIYFTSKRDDIEKAKIEEKQQYYKEQAKQFKELEEDPTTPGAFKKIMKAFRVISEGLIDGIAVFYGAKTGGKFIKNLATKGAGSSFAKKAGKAFKPIFDGIKSSTKYVSDLAGNAITTIKATSWFEKFSNNKIGKFIIGGFKKVASGFKKVIGWIAEGFNKIFAPIRNAKGSVYDKATKATATTLGVGAGTAGAYTAAAKPGENETEETSVKTKDVEDDKNSIQNHFENILDDNDDEDDLIDDIENDYNQIEDAEILDEKLYEED